MGLGVWPSVESRDNGLERFARLRRDVDFILRVQGLVAVRGLGFYTHRLHSSSFWDYLIGF